MSTSDLSDLTARSLVDAMRAHTAALEANTAAVQKKTEEMKSIGTLATEVRILRELLEKFSPDSTQGRELLARLENMIRQFDDAANRVGSAVSQMGNRF